jgi:hypothetical protein
VRDPAIAALVPDVVALQEIAAHSVQRLRAALPDIGLPHTVDSRPTGHTKTDRKL